VFFPPYYAVSLGEKGPIVHQSGGQTCEPALVGQRGHQRLALARAHFGDVAGVQHHAANHLDVEMTLAERAAGSFTHGGEGGDQKIVDRFAGGQLSPEFFRLGSYLVVAQLRNVWLKCIDGGHLWGESLEAAVIGGAENLFREGSEHEKPLSSDSPHPTGRPAQTANGWPKSTAKDALVRACGLIALGLNSERRPVR
jgi:hypothetical protein